MLFLILTVCKSSGMRNIITILVLFLTKIR